MPKKNDAYEQFLADLIAAVPDDKRAMVEETLKSDTVGAKLREGVLARADYSRQSDTLRTEREAFQAEVAEARQNITGWQQWYTGATQDYASLQERVTAYEEAFGALDGKEPVHRDQNYLTKQEYEAALAQRDALAIQFADTLTDLKFDHKDKFGERLDTTKLIAFARERGLPIDSAYREFIADRVEERRQKDTDERIQKAKEEGAREYATTHRLPFSTGPSEAHPLDNAQKVPGDSRERVRAAVAAWNSAPTHSTS
jgi:hypothetical protein